MTASDTQELLIARSENRELRAKLAEVNSAAEAMALDSQASRENQALRIKLAGAWTNEELLEAVSTMMTPESASKFVDALVDTMRDARGRKS